MLHGSSRCAIAAAIAASLSACSDDPATAVEPNLSGPSVDPLASAPNESVISLRGTVISTTPTSFRLDYGSGTATVEMDDWDWYQEGRALNMGDRVTVTGRVDADLFQEARLEAESVYVENLGASFYANDADEEDLSAATYVAAPAGATAVYGSVLSIEGREFVLGSGTGSIRVDTAEMQDNPLDGEGNPRVRAGDRLYTWGRLDIDAGEADELMAQGLVVLRQDRTRRSGGSNAAGQATSNQAAANTSAGNQSADK